MEELLKALKDDDPISINKYAMELLVTKNRELNKLEVNAFESYAHCKINPWPASTIYKARCYIGTIIYKGKEYGFG